MDKRPVNHMAPGVTLQELAERALTDPNPDLSAEEAARLRLEKQVVSDSNPAPKQKN